MTEINSRQLGCDGPVVSAIGLGCMSLSGTYGEADDAKSISLIHHAIDMGVNHLDTSDMYGWGHNEGIVGTAIKGRRAAHREVYLTIRRFIRRTPRFLAHPSVPSS
ncbi:MAG: aldo/keto reductase [Hyphomicrobiaceae bacterium]